MRTLLLRYCFVLFSIPLLPSLAESQPLPTRTERLFHVGKVWGYIKYFYPGAAGCTNNMDSVLLKAVRVVDTAAYYDSFERGLLLLFQQAGPIELATEPEIEIDTIKKLNLDLRWHQDAALPSSVRSKLDSIRVNFRPFDNCYFRRGANTTVYTIQEETYSAAIATKSSYPLLLLFRAWNIHNYYSPYKHLLGAAWDSALIDLIPHFERVSSVLDLHLAFMRYQSRQADAHSTTSSNELATHFGPNYLPCILTFVEGKTVITKVFAGVDGLRVGDVVVSMDGTPTQAIRDSLRPYAHGGSPEIIERNISNYLLRGKSMSCSVEVLNTDGQRSVVLQRSSNASQVADSLYHPKGDGNVWKMLPGNIGYVNVGQLTVEQVGDMYYDLESTSAIIFDMRNYPREFVIYDVADLLLPSSRPFCNFYYPEPDHPGTFESTMLQAGPYFPNPDYYRGQVLILQNEVTQSQAEFTIMAWQTHPNAKIFGSQTAGADGNVSAFSFPTGLTLRYSGCGVVYPDGGETQIVGIEEDVTVTPTIAGIRSGRDEVLEAALASLSVEKDDQGSASDLWAVVDRGGLLSLDLPVGIDSGGLTLYDLLGRLVLRRSYSGAAIDISHLPNGSYLLEFSSQETTRRTCIQKAR